MRIRIRFGLDELAPPAASSCPLWGRLRRRALGAAPLVRIEYPMDCAGYRTESQRDQAYGVPTTLSDWIPMKNSNATPPSYDHIKGGPTVVPHSPKSDVNLPKEKAEEEVAGRHKNSGQIDHKGAR